MVTYATGKAAAGITGGSLTINLTIDSEKLVRFLKKWPITLKQQDQAIYRALNETIAQYKTAVTGRLVVWTGIKLKRRITQGMTQTRAGPGNWSAALNVRDQYILVTRRYFKASWRRGMIGASHVAWSRPQIAKRTFMISGKQPIFKHKDQAHPKHRGDLVALSGPNPAREMVRHLAEVQAMLSAISSTKFIPRVVHHLQRSAAAAAG